MKGYASTKTYKEDHTTGEESKQDNKLSTCAQQSCTMIVKNKTWNVIVATEVSLPKTTVPYLLNSGETTLSHFPFFLSRQETKSLANNNTMLLKT